MLPLNKTQLHDRYILSIIFCIISSIIILVLIITEIVSGVKNKGNKTTFLQITYYIGIIIAILLGLNITFDVFMAIYCNNKLKENNESNNETSKE